VAEWLERIGRYVRLPSSSIGYVGLIRDQENDDLDCDDDAHTELKVRQLKAGPAQKQDGC
jgi:hypothetical protein